MYHTSNIYIFPLINYYIHNNNNNVNISPYLCTNIKFIVENQFQTLINYTMLQNDG